MYDLLFSPGKIGNVTIKNRLVMSPMGTNIAGLDGCPHEEMIRFYEERAIGGCGLIYTEVCRVNEAHGAAMLRQLSLTRDRNIAPMSKLVAAVHKHGTKIFCQLHHPGNETVTLLTGGETVVSASDVVCKFVNQPTRALTHEEVLSLEQDFIDAAVRAQKAGFDGVELHAAHGYLIGQFFSPYTNKRTDEFGGSLENRCRFVVDIIRGIHAACGEDYPVTIRLSVDEFLDTTGVTEDYIHVEDGIEIAKAMERAGVAAINVSCGVYESGLQIIEPTDFPQGRRSPFVKQVKEAVSVPVIAVNNVKEPDVAEKLLADGVQDFVSLGRAWLADPEWGLKAREGRACDIHKCIGCLNCFDSLNNNMAVGMPPRCAVNPRLCKETKYPNPKIDTLHRRVAVIGGGPAGLSAAYAAAQRGMKVTLLEKSERLGGLVNYAAAAPNKQDMHWVVDCYERALKAAGVDVRLNTEATLDTVKALSPDAVIVASGNKSVFPKSIPGIDGDNVYSIADILGGTSGLADKTVVIAGAGVTGLECGLYLNARGCRTTIVDMLDKVAPNDIPTIVMDDCAHLAEGGTEFLLSHALKEIRKSSVVLTDCKTQEDKELACDAVVISLGLVPDNEIYNALKDALPEVHLVGGADDPAGRIPGATNSAYDTVYHLFDAPKPSFLLTRDEIARYGSVNDMKSQEGVYCAWLSDPAAIRKILPPQLGMFAMPIVTLSVAHVNEPTFADDYYEAILGVFATMNDIPGMYPVAMVLGGPGAEMAALTGREDAGMGKKTGAEFVIRRNGDRVKATVTRRGTQLIDLDMEIGEYNNPLCDQLYFSPGPGVTTQGGTFLYKFDRMVDEDAQAHYLSGALYGEFSSYLYKTWEPGFVDLKLKSSIDDPWAELPIHSIVGGAYSTNDLYLTPPAKVMDLDADEVVPYLLTGRFDRTLFMETGRK